MADMETSLGDLLRNGSMKGKSNDEINATISGLIHGTRHKSHTYPILYTEAKKDLNLNVELWDINETRWKILWTYYQAVSRTFKMIPESLKLLETKDP